MWYKYLLLLLLLYCDFFVASGRPVLSFRQLTEPCLKLSFDKRRCLQEKTSGTQLSPEKTDFLALLNVRSELAVKS